MEDALTGPVWLLDILRGITFGLSFLLAVIVVKVSRSSDTGLDVAPDGPNKAAMLSYAALLAATMVDQLERFGDPVWGLHMILTGAALILAIIGSRAYVAIEVLGWRERAAIRRFRRRREPPPEH